MSTAAYVVMSERIVGWGIAYPRPDAVFLTRKDANAFVLKKNRLGGSRYYFVKRANMPAVEVEPAKNATADVANHKQEEE